MKRPKAVRRSTRPPTRAELVALLAAAGLLSTSPLRAEPADASAESATLVLSGLSPQSHVEIDGRALSDAEAQQPILVSPGHHQLSVSAGDASSIRMVVNVAAGETSNVRIPSAEPPPLGGVPPVRDYGGCCSHTESVAGGGDTAQLASLAGLLVLGVRRRRRRT